MRASRLFARSVALLAVCFVPLQAQASLTAWLDQAERQSLHEHQRWLQLGHYETSGWRSPVSDISSDDFFLHPQGRTDPEAELLATIEALFAPAEQMGEQHAQCRFPARRLWLTRVMEQAPDDMPEVNCVGFSGWQGQGDQAIESVSLIAVEGYLRNPSSLYGHVLLKLNQRNPDERNLLATSVNFGVDLPSGESPVRFIAQGLFGGYDAVFSHARFHQNSILYGDFQQRDLWDYRLDLTAEQVDMVVAHTWELLGMEFPYYFTGSNCAYRTAAVLDLVLDESLGNRFKPWVMPHDTFNNLMRQRTASGAPLVAEISYFPSRRSVFSAAWDDLSGDEQSVVKAFVTDPQAAQLDDINSQPSGAAVLDALIHYYSMDVDTSLDPTLHRALLSARLALPATEETVVSPEGRARPVHEANFPNMVQLSPGLNEQLGAGLEARFRLTYYDMLARPVARPAFSELSMLDVRLWVDESSNLTLRRLDVLNLDTLNVSQTGLPGDGGWTTRLRLGYEDTHSACVNCGEFFLEGGRGLAAGRSDQYAFYGLLSARVASGDTGLLSLTPETGLIVQPVPAWSSLLALGYRARVGDDPSEGQPILHLGNRFGTSQRWDVRANARYHETTDLSLGLSVYW